MSQIEMFPDTGGRGLTKSPLKHAEDVSWSPLKLGGVLSAPLRPHMYSQLFHILKTFSIENGFYRQKCASYQKRMKKVVANDETDSFIRLMQVVFNVIRQARKQAGSKDGGSSNDAFRLRPARHLTPF